MKRELAAFLLAQEAKFQIEDETKKNQESGTHKDIQRIQDGDRVIQQAYDQHNVDADTLRCRLLRLHFSAKCLPFLDVS